MEKKLLIIFLALFGFTQVWGQGDYSVQEQFWKGICNALQEDVKLKNDKESRIQEEKRNEIFKSGMEEIQGCLKKPYSKRNAQKAIEKISYLKKNMQLSEEQTGLLAKYKKLIMEYGNQAKKFCKIFEGDVADSDFQRYRKEDPGALIPPRIKTMSESLKKHYVDNGLDTLEFLREYEYLNLKLAELKSNFADIEKMPSNDGNKPKMYKKLEDIVKIESEISEEHKSYHALK